MSPQSGRGRGLLTSVEWPHASVLGYMQKWATYVEKISSEYPKTPHVLGIKPKPQLLNRGYINITKYLKQICTGPWRKLTKTLFNRWLFYRMVTIPFLFPDNSMWSAYGTDFGSQKGKIIELRTTVILHLKTARKLPTRVTLQKPQSLGQCSQPSTEILSIWFRSFSLPGLIMSISMEMWPKQPERCLPALSVLAILGST